jgi:NAD-dependent SIR2 family protein deacetylase
MTRGDVSGSYCPVCTEDSGVDAEDWFRDHEHNKVAVCQNCGAKLKAYYDEYEEDGGFWAFEEAEAS